MATIAVGELHGCSIFNTENDSMSKPKVFVTRILPEVGMRLIEDACDAEVWRDPMPPPADVLRFKLAGIDGLASLLTDRLDAATLDFAPRLKVISNFAVGFNNIDIPACTARGAVAGSMPPSTSTSQPGFTWSTSCRTR